MPKKTFPIALKYIDLIKLIWTLRKKNVLIIIGMSIEQTSFRMRRRLKSVRRQQEITGAGERLTHHSTREPHHLRLGTPGQAGITRKSSQPRMERHLRDHTATAFPLTSQKTGLPQQRTAPPTSAATTTRRARPPLPASSGCLRSFVLRASSRATAAWRRETPKWCQLPSASPQREFVSDDFQSPTIQAVERTKVEVAP